MAGPQGAAAGEGQWQVASGEEEQTSPITLLSTHKSFCLEQASLQHRVTHSNGVSLSLLCKHMHIRVCIDLHVLILMNEKSP